MSTLNYFERPFKKKQFTIFKGALSNDAITAFCFKFQIVSHCVNYDNKNIASLFHSLIKCNNSILLDQINHWP